MSVIAIIPARGGSKGVPKKNIYPIAGKPVIGYVIDAAKKALKIDRILVSTDDAEIAEVAKKFGAEVVMRPAELADDTSAVDGALRHALNYAEKDGDIYEIVAWLQANVPTTKSDVIDKAVNKIIETNASSVQTVVPYRAPPQWSWRLDDDKLIQLEGCHSYTVTRQETVQSYHFDGSVNVMRRENLLKSNKRGDLAYFGSDRRAIVQSPIDGIEIDEPIDLDFCEFILTRNNK